MADVGIGNNKGKKSLNADVNLVPFIDLLSMCICFLLMTAVWIQLTTVEVKQVNGTTGVSATQSIELNLEFIKGTAIKLEVKKAGKLLQSDVLKGKVLEDSTTQIAAWITQFNARNIGKIESVLITASEDVNYGAMMAIMDQFRSKGIVNFGVVSRGTNASR